MTSSLSSQINALRRLFGLTLAGFAALLFYQAYALNKNQLNYQNALMESVSKSVLKELTHTLANKRLKISLIHSNNKETFDEFYRSAKDIDQARYMSMLKLIRSELPESRLFTLISPEGRNLLEHITGQFLSDCQLEVKDVVMASEQKNLFLHRSRTSSHYDLIQLRNELNTEEGFIFVAFNINFITELLAKYQLPYQELFLLRNDHQGMIELSNAHNESNSNEGGSNNVGVKSRFLTNIELNNFEHKLNIPNTRWSFAIRLDPNTKAKMLETIAKQAFVTWLVITLLMYLAFQLIKRNLESKFKAEENLARSRQQADTIINSVNEAVLSINEQLTITYANNRAAAIFYITRDNLIGKPFHSVCSLYNQTQNSRREFVEIVADYEKNQSSEFANLMLKVGENPSIPVAVKLSKIYARNNTAAGFTITIEDLSTAIELSKRLIFNESRDNLTGLFNRRKFDSTLSKHIQFVKNNKVKTYKSALILIDLDKFQLLNTIHGFEAGDEFLKRVANIITESLPDKCEIARSSSDEFITLIKETNSDEVKQLCQSIKQALRRFEFKWEQEIISTTACLGVVYIDEQFDSVNQLLSAADHACRIAKAKGSNITQYYETDDPEIKRRTEEILQHSDIQKAIVEGRFTLFKQAIIPLGNTQKSPPKFELLIRMLSPTGEIVPPIKFIPVAEKYGMMNTIDQWVLTAAFEKIARDEKNKATSYNINLSSQTLGDIKLTAFVSELFAKHNLSPTCINFEITETSAISYLENALHFMKEMKALGCTFSLDDFGTGLASFDYLKKLPIDYLKIDGAFVKDILTNPNDLAFTDAIHKLASQMGLKTVAEFVESQEVQDKLTNIGINFAQGYHIEKPNQWLNQ